LKGPFETASIRDKLVNMISPVTLGGVSALRSRHHLASMYFWRRQGTDGTKQKTNLLDHGAVDTLALFGAIRWATFNPEFAA
jgi:hypothetical protein